MTTFSSSEDDKLGFFREKVELCLRVFKELDDSHQIRAFRLFRNVIHEMESVLSTHCPQLLLSATKHDSSGPLSPSGGHEFASFAAADKLCSSHEFYSFLENEAYNASCSMLASPSRNDALLNASDLVLSPVQTASFFCPPSETTATDEAIFTEVCSILEEMVQIVERRIHNPSSATMTTSSTTTTTTTTAAFKSIRSRKQKHRISQRLENKKRNRKNPFPQKFDSPESISSIISIQSIQSNVEPFDQPIEYEPVALERKQNKWKTNQSYECDLCQVQFKKLASFERHQLSAAHMQRCSEEPVPNEKRKFLCHTCGKHYLRKDHLIRHLSVHSQTKYSCTVCDFRTQHKLNLTMHMKRHEREQTVKCPICHKMVSNLRSHQQYVHNNECKFTCDVCAKGFKTSCLLQRHKMCHSEAKEFTCFCGAKFRRPDNLKRHQSRVHKMEKPSRKVPVVQNNMENDESLLADDDDMHQPLCETALRTDDGITVVYQPNSGSSMPLYVTVAHPSGNSMDGALLYQSNFVTLSPYQEARGTVLTNLVHELPLELTTIGHDLMLTTPNAHGYTPMPPISTVLSSKNHSKSTK